MIKEISAGGMRAMQYLPDTATNDQKLPCLIEFNGMGENANDGDISLVYVHGPFRFLKDGTWKPPFSVINMFPPVDFPTPQMVNDVVNSVRQMPNVDTNRLYATGLSAGAETWMLYFEYYLQAKTVIAAAMINSLTNKPCNNYSASPVAAQNVLGIPIHFFHGVNDVLPHNIQPVRSVYNDLKTKGSPVAMTEIPNMGHDIWEITYDPAYKGAEGGISAYDWLLKHSLAVTPVPPIPPAPKLVSVITVQVFDNGTTKVSQTDPTKLHLSSLASSLTQETSNEVGNSVLARRLYNEQERKDNEQKAKGNFGHSPQGTY